MGPIFIRTYWSSASSVKKKQKQQTSFYKELSLLRGACFVFWFRWSHWRPESPSYFRYSYKFLPSFHQHYRRNPSASRNPSAHPASTLAPKCFKTAQNLHQTGHHPTILHIRSASRCRIPLRISPDGYNPFKLVLFRYAWKQKQHKHHMYFCKTDFMVGLHLEITGSTQTKITLF